MKSKWDEIGNNVFGKGWRQKAKANRAREEKDRREKLEETVAQERKIYSRGFGE